MFRNLANAAAGGTHRGTSPCIAGGRPFRRCGRDGKVLVLLVVALPAVLGIVGLVFDAGMLSSDSRNLQHAVDAGSTAAAMELLLGKTNERAEETATSFVHDLNGQPAGQLTIDIPPATGPFSGRMGFIEVRATHPYRTRVMQVLGLAQGQTFAARAVAGYEDSTAGAAVMVLDPNPTPFTVGSIPPLLPALPAVVGGLEVLGIGQVRVDGAVLVNTTWGGVDENGEPAGDGPGPPYAVSCTPMLGSSTLAARDIRVVGGVDEPSNYSNFDPANDSPLRANRLPVPDPFAQLPSPSTSSDSSNVSTQLRGSVEVVGLPLVGPPVTLSPGVYDWISVVSGIAVFEPGIYIIRGRHPATQLSLSIRAGAVTADGVLFYITDSAAYDASSGTPDDGDGETAPPMNAPGTRTPSVLINVSLLNSSFSGLNDPASPFHDMLIYQRRLDQRPVAIVHQDLIGSGSLAGTIYAKWGHVTLIGNGTYNIRLLGGTVRIIAVTDLTIAPDELLPPAQDVYLVE